MVTIVIDALDECDRSRRSQLIQALQDIMIKSATLIKIFISSRNDTDIVYRFSDYPNLELSSMRNEHDIKQYVTQETARLVTMGDLLCFSADKKDLQAKIISHVSTKADGM